MVPSLVDLGDFEKDNNIYGVLCTGAQLKDDNSLGYAGYPQLRSVALFLEPLLGEAIPLMSTGGLSHTNDGTAEHQAALNPGGILGHPILNGEICGSLQSFPTVRSPSVRSVSHTLTARDCMVLEDKAEQKTLAEPMHSPHSGAAPNGQKQSRTLL